MTHKIFSHFVTWIKDKVLHVWNFFWKSTYKVTLWQGDPFLNVEIKGEPGESRDSVLRRGKIEFARRLNEIIKATDSQNL